MSTLKVTNIQDTSGGNSLTTAQLYSGAAKAWVNFDGTGAVGTQTIRSSFNVSSVYKNGTGDYTVNFSSALVDANHVVQFGGYDKNGTGNVYMPLPTFSTPSTTSVRVFTSYYTGGNIIIRDDVSYICVGIFR